MDKAFAIYDETPLDNIINSAVNLKRLYRGKEFYASAFPGSQGLTGAVADLFDWLLARGKSEFFHIQSLSPDKILTVLKASAAVPWPSRPRRSTAGFTGTGALAAGTGEHPHRAPCRLRLYPHHRRHPRKQQPPGSQGMARCQGGGDPSFHTHPADGEPQSPLGFFPGSA